MFASNQSLLRSTRVADGNPFPSDSLANPYPTNAILNPPTLEGLQMVDLYEERALILSKLGEHEKALTIYAHRLGDIQMAQEYCERLYNSADPATRHVYLDLLKVSKPLNPNP